MTAEIAIAAASAIYPSGVGVEALWDTVLFKRRCFRELPPSRLPTNEYIDSRYASDTMSKTRVGLISGWSFDPQEFRVPSEQYAVTDPVHWLTIDAATRLMTELALVRSPEPARVGVVIGNSLAGETSRSNALRLRWPYVQRVLAEVGDELGRPLSRDFIRACEDRFKLPFPAPSSDSLSGGLANTIAGRVCNHFDFHGLGYTIDAACASSLVSVIHAKQLLQSGVLDLVIAGGVDMSLDPFELIGFSRLGALATEQMRIYDADPTGFFPGEGCGLVALARLDDVLEWGGQPIAVLGGAGMSSDGQGGLTRPAEAGHLLAARRAFAEACIDPEAVELFEGHGTGTAVGDAAELAVFHTLRSPDSTPAAIGSVKANIGHTKAAAGVAGLIKAAYAVNRAVLPPTTGVESPHPLLRDMRNLRVLDEAERWASEHRYAAVSALGFGGINAHVIVNNVVTGAATAAAIPVSRSAEHAVLMITGASAKQAAVRLQTLLDRSEGFSDAECVSAIEHASRNVEPSAPVRVSFVAGSLAEFQVKAARCIELLDARAASDTSFALTPDGVAVGTGTAGEVGLVFPGQNARWIRALPAVDRGIADGDGWITAAVLGLDGAAGLGGTGTDLAQPLIAASSFAGLGWLTALGVRAHAAVGHSLGELVALAWAGYLEPVEMMRLIQARGRVMHRHGPRETGMVALDVDAPTATALLAESRLTRCEVAAVNSNTQVVVGGPRDELYQLAEFARRRRFAARHLSVPHAFHTADMLPAAREFAPILDKQRWQAPNRRRTVISTVSGAALDAQVDVAGLLRDQLASPVRFSEASEALAAQVSLVLEVGSDGGLAELLNNSTGIPAVQLSIGGDRRALAEAVSALFALGQLKEPAAWWATAAPPYWSFEQQPQLLTNPTGVVAAGRANESRPATSGGLPASANTVEAGEDGDGAFGDEPVIESSRIPQVRSREVVTEPEALAALVGAVAEFTGFKLGSITGGLRFSSDLRLNSLQVNHVVGRVAHELGRPVPQDPLALSDSSLADAAAFLAQLPAADADDESALPAGEPWVNTFCDHWTELDMAAPGAAQPMPATESQCIVDLTGADPSTATKRLCQPDSASQVLVVTLPVKPSVAHVMCLRDWVLERDWECIVVEHAGTGAAVARTLYHERTQLRQRWVLVERDRAAAPLAAFRALNGLPTAVFADLKVSPGGTVFQRGLRRLRGTAERTVSLARGDLVLVTGGLHGITAECAFELVKHTDASLLFVGRTSPEDRAVSKALSRLRAAGVEASYRQADLTDRQALNDSLKDVAGRVRGIIHGAAVNTPERSESVPGHRVVEAAEVKQAGLANLLELIQVEGLSLLVTFGSIIARAGLAGQLAYAHANELLRVMTEELADRAVCPVLHFEWSIWSGTGMAVSLGVVDALQRTGVVPISVLRGRQVFWEQLCQSGPVARLVTGRYPSDGTVSFVSDQEVQRPTLRYVEDIALHVPMTEIVTTAELSVYTDRSLREHQVGGLPVLPLVCVLEAVAQSATYLDPERAWLCVRSLRVHNPVTLKSESERVPLTVVISETGAIGDDSLGAVVLSGAVKVASLDLVPRTPHVKPAMPSQFDGVPGPYYEAVLFHEGAFRRIQSVDCVTAFTLSATLNSDPSSWFSTFLPADLILGDTGVLDAALHAIQLCYPQRQLLPVGAREFVVLNPTPSGPCSMIAMQRDVVDGDLVFDVDLLDASGELVLCWRRLRLRASHALDFDGPVELVGPWLVREVLSHRWSESIDGVVTSSARGAQDVLRETAATEAVHDPAGRLVVVGRGAASTSKLGGKRLTVWADDVSALGVDWQSCGSESPALPTDLAALAAELHWLGESEGSHLAWAANEAIRKAGLSSAGLRVVDDAQAAVNSCATLQNADVNVVVALADLGSQRIAAALAISRR